VFAFVQALDGLSPFKALVTGTMASLQLVPLVPSMQVVLVLVFMRTGHAADE
jgi:hypothetical protein